jgi:hypothetical protein
MRVGDGLEIVVFVVAHLDVFLVEMSDFESARTRRGAVTMCPNSKAACECQPQDGVMCPHGPQPPFQPWAPEPPMTPASRPPMKEEEMEWMPIETMPKQGSFLVYIPEENERRRFHVAEVRANVVVIGGCFSFDRKPATHWCRLPPPPKEQE